MTVVKRVLVTVMMMATTKVVTTTMATIMVVMPMVVMPMVVTTTAITRTRINMQVLLSPVCIFCSSTNLNFAFSRHNLQLFM